MGVYRVHFRYWFLLCIAGLVVCVWKGKGKERTSSKGERGISTQERQGGCLTAICIYG